MLQVVVDAVQQVFRDTRRKARHLVPGPLGRELAPVGLLSRQSLMGGAGEHEGSQHRGQREARRGGATMGGCHGGHYQEGWEHEEPERVASRIASEVRSRINYNK